MLRSSAIFLFLLIFNSSYAQRDYAREILDKLCAPEMYGRAYVNRGDSIAAAYIASEYEKMRLLSPKKNWFHEFELSVNSFPTQWTVSVDGLTLMPGKEFLINPLSSEGGLEHDVYMINPKDLLDSSKLYSKLIVNENSFAVLDRRDQEFSPEEEKAINELNAYIMLNEDHHLAGFIQIYPPEHKGLWSIAPIASTRVGADLFSETIPKKFKGIKIEGESKLMRPYKSQNVYGIIPGYSPDSMIIVCAHYDHLGMMGPDAYFPGASDNASGVAMLLSLAKHFSTNPPKNDIMFVCFGGEEAGLIGSRMFTMRPPIPIDKVKLVLNLDIMSTGVEGIKVVNGTVYKDKFDRLVETNRDKNYILDVKIRGERCNSDHCPFHEKGIPSFFAYTLGGKAEYHNVYDTPETLELQQFDNILDLFKDYLEDL